MHDFHRRTFLKTVGATVLGGATWPFKAAAGSAGVPAGRDFHVCANIDLLEANPDYLDVVSRAGVGTIWLAGYFYGHWPWPVDRLGQWRRKIEAKGLRAEVVTVPLGHPGDSLGSSDKGFPLTPPAHWKMAQGVDGAVFCGTSLHEPATQENAAAVAALAGEGFRCAFLDDDFRLARGPGAIGGCFCAEHQAQFLKAGGYPRAKWDELRGDVTTRTLSPLLRSWVEFNCDALTESFRSQRQAAQPMDLGVMVMYLGAEKAGIRLRDYADTMLRVGELMFDDRSFAPVKGKTDELFSALFHRRFVRPELAFSETTAFPADQLSADNMAAKLVVATLADVRHTMFMSGLSSFPASHWDTLGPAMKRAADMHKVVAGHPLRGPFKHFHGERERYIGADQPFSLFLALGVPFEVCDEPVGEGWTFLADADAAAVRAGVLKAPGARWIARTSAVPDARLQAMPEDFDELWAFKDSVVPQLGETPYVRDRKPVVCAWYPSADAVVLWNLAEQAEEVQLVQGTRSRAVQLSPLGATLVYPLSA